MDPCLRDAGILFALFIPRADAAAASYDQQQTGSYNVDAKFENFLFVFLDSDKGGPLSKLAQEALQVLQFNSLTSPRGASKHTAEKLSEATVYETEDKDEGREPYHVEIVRIEKDEGENAARSKHLEKSETPGGNSGGKIEPGTSSKSLEGGPNPEVSIDNKKPGKRARSLWRNEESRGLLDASLVEQRKRPVHVKYSTVENLAQSDDLSVKEEVPKATRPGMSLKKQLSRKEEKDVTSMSEERNELTNKSQELVLLGGGIENCGPGRYRDQSGICQNDKYFY